MSNKRRLRNAGERPKAFWGALIGGLFNMAAGMYSAKQQAKLQREQIENQNRLAREANERAIAEQTAASLNNYSNAVKDINRTEYLEYSNGGRRRLRNNRVSITDGGPVLNLSTGGLYYPGDKVPYGRYLDLGPTHEQRNSSGNTGTGWEVNGKHFETEHNEVEDIIPDEMKIYSDTIPLPNGNTPAKEVLNGGDEKYAFAMQQAMNGNFGVGNKRSLRCGGHISRPVGRIRADFGLWTSLKNGYNWVTEQLRKLDEATTLDAVKNNPYMNTGIVTAPGRMGANPAAVQRGIQATRHLANSVRQAIRKATPVNTTKVVTKVPKIVTAPKGDVLRAEREAARAYSWRNTTPMEQAGYAGGVAGRGTAPGTYGVEGLEGTLRFPGAYRITLNDNPWILPASTAGGIGLVAGLNYLGQQGEGNTPTQQDYTYIDNNRLKVKVPAIGYTAPTKEDVDTQLNNAIAISKLPFKSSVVSNGTSTRGSAIKRTPTLVNRGQIEPVAPTRNTIRLADIKGLSDIPEDTSLPEQGIKIIEPDKLREIRENGSSPEGYNSDKWGMRLKGSDWINFGADAIGNLALGLYNNSALSGINTSYVLPEYMDETPVSFDTTYHNEAQRSNVLRAGLRGRKTIANNVASAQVGRGLMQNLDTDTMMKLNELNDYKVNKEIELRNKNKENEQQVRARNSYARNRWYEQLAAIRNKEIDANNRLAQARIENMGNIIAGFGDATNNLITQGQQRYADEQAQVWGLARLGEKDRNWALRHLDLSRGTRRRLNLG